MYRMIKLFSLFGIAVFLFVSCANAEIRTGWAGSDSPGESSYRFK